MFGLSIPPQDLHYEVDPCPHSASIEHIFCCVNDYKQKKKIRAVFDTYIVSKCATE